MRLYRASLLSLITVTDENVGSIPTNRSSGTFPDIRSGRVGILSTLKLNSLDVLWSKREIKDADEAKHCVKIRRVGNDIYDNDTSRFRQACNFLPAFTTNGQRILPNRQRSRNQHSRG